MDTATLIIVVTLIVCITILCATALIIVGKLKTNGGGTASPEPEEPARKEPARKYPNRVFSFADNWDSPPKYVICAYLLANSPKPLTAKRVHTKARALNNGAYRLKFKRSSGTASMLSNMSYYGLLTCTRRPGTSDYFYEITPACLDKVLTVTYFDGIDDND